MRNIQINTNLPNSPVFWHTLSRYLTDCIPYLVNHDCVQGRLQHVEGMPSSCPRLPGSRLTILTACNPCTHFCLNNSQLMSNFYRKIIIICKTQKGKRNPVVKSTDSFFKYLKLLKYLFILIRTCSITRLNCETSKCNYI